MRVTAIRRETKLVDIADCLFGDLTPETRKIAEAALLKANPELAKPEALRPGVIIQVPEVAGLKRNPARSGEDPVGEARNILKGALSGYRDLLIDRFKAERTELETQRELLGMILENVDIAPDLRAITDGLEGTLRARMEENKSKRGDVLPALDRALKDLGE